MLTMSDDWKSVEFESEIDAHGNIRVPAEVLGHFEQPSGVRMHVRLTGYLMSSELRKNGVTEEEIDRIKSLQLESRDQVVKFLLTEGALAKNRRIGGRLGKPARGTRR